MSEKEELINITIHPDLYLDWCEGLVCNVCKEEVCHTKLISGLWLCDICFKKIIEVADLSAQMIGEDK